MDSFFAPDRPARRGRTWVFAVTLGLWAHAIAAQDFSYRYVSLNEVTLPEGVLFFDPVALDNGGRVHATAFVCDTTACESLVPHVSTYANGNLTIKTPGFVVAANDAGTVGGSVLTDPVNFIEQAALFHHDRVELVPRQPGEFTSVVTALNNSGSALVMSFDASFEPTFVQYKNGESTVIDFGPTVTNPSRLAINNHGIISGTQGDSLCDGASAFRLDSRTGETTLLEPLSTEPAAWGLDINSRGDVLGYSFVCGGTERVGVWDRKGNFRGYFVEGTGENPTVSNELLFNDNGLIVITSISSPDAEQFVESYLVPRPGTRLRLADLIENGPPGANLSSIRDINNHGDMIGFDFLTGDVFLLQRTGQ